MSSKPKSETKTTNRLRMMSKPEVLELVGVSFPTLWTWMRDGKFPRSRDLNGKPGWLAGGRCP